MVSKTSFHILIKNPESRKNTALYILYYSLMIYDVMWFYLVRGLMGHVFVHTLCSLQCWITQLLQWLLKWWDVYPHSCSRWHASCEGWFVKMGFVFYIAHLQLHLHLQPSGAHFAQANTEDKLGKCNKIDWYIIRKGSIVKYVFHICEKKLSSNANL